MTLLDEVLAAHGGREAWESAREVTARIRGGGIALPMKGAHAPFREFRVQITMAEPRAVITPYPGGRGVYERDSVWIESDRGDVIERRDDMRRRFPGGRRRLWWDRLDGLYFAGYALWNYFTTPLLLTRCELRERGRELMARFPPDVPSHAPTTKFTFDERGLLTRLDYTAQVFGEWARAKHLCSGHETFDGLVYPTVRRVTPRRWSGPVLVALDVDEVSVSRA
ncbi:MAG TPA: hypothetical protein VGF25_12740 [Thermoleophilaceae bacterium]